MSHEIKMRTTGGKSMPERLTVAKLIAFAEQVIRTDKSSALRAQGSVSDLTAKTNDRSQTPARISALADLCGRTGSVKIKDGTPPEGDDQDEKLIRFNKPRVGS